jgi:membrane-associated protease RseP (regulator of RpoE activity)
VGAPGNYYVRISHVSLGTEIAAGVLVAAVAGAGGALGAQLAGGHGYTPIYAGAPAPMGSLPIHPEVVPADKAAPEMQALAYAKPTDNPLPNQQPRLGLSYDMTDGTGAGHPVAGGKVTLVLPDTAAARAGILPGDVLVSIGGTEVKTNDSVRQLVHAAAPGIGVPIVLYRDGQKLEVTAQL